MPRFIALAVSILLCSFFSQAQVNPDFVELKSGNRIYGEVKSLKFSILKFDTDQAGLLSIKWRNVVKISSVDQFEIYLPKGDLIIGSIDTTERDFQVKVTDREGVEKILRLEDLTSFTDVNSTFKSRIDGFIKAGFSYTKASDVAQFNTSAEVAYRTYHDEVKLGGSSIYTRQRGSGDTMETDRQQNLFLDYRRFFKHRWYVNINTGVEQNTELGVRSRVKAGATVGKTLFENKSQFFQAGIGSTYTWERSDDGQEQSNMEGVAGFYYKVYKHTMPKIYLTSNLATFPSFTTPGRVRLYGQIDFDIELIDDFTIGITNYHNFDNQPISATAATYDWGITFNLGYSF